MKRLVQAAVVLGVALLCLATNPSQARHQEKIKQAFRSENQVLGKIGIGEVYARSFEYHNLLLCSLTTAEGKVKSFGVLGMVFTY